MGVNYIKPTSVDDPKPTAGCSESSEKVSDLDSGDQDCHGCQDDAHKVRDGNVKTVRTYYYV